MKKLTIEQGDATYVGEVVSATLKWDGRELNFENVREAEMVSWMKTGKIVMTDGTRFELYRNREALLLTGQITLRVASLTEDICFDVGSIRQFCTA